MLINYNIIWCEQLMKQNNYAAKDLALEDIKRNYIDKTLTDKDLLSLGKYFCQYGQYYWAEEMIRPRITKLDVDEDLLFFYINLEILLSAPLDSLHDILLNAISINNDRFCRFFSAIDQGGISMQLLVDTFWKQLYCENCRFNGIKRSTNP